MISDPISENLIAGGPMDLERGSGTILKIVVGLNTTSQTSF